MHSRSSLAAFVASLVIFASCHVAPAVEQASPNDVARFLAGMAPAPQSPLAPLTRDPGWQRYAKSFDDAWDALEKRQLAKIRPWSEQHIKLRQKTLYYMFSGPDFLYANAFFPDASNYLLSGLEPVGGIPEANARTARSLPALRSSIASALQLSFFRTKDMRKQLRGGELAGTLPILYVYLARSGKTIHDVSLVALDAEGGVSLAEQAEARRRTASGVKIVFSSGDGPQQTLYYFSTDLSDSGVRSSGFLKFAATLGAGDGLLKSASYLLHGSNFLRVRDFILLNAHTIVQDDSGIPVSAFSGELWHLHPFGAYHGPINLFPNRHQPQLQKLYKASSPPPLDFGIGYRWRGYDSNVQLAIKKDAADPQVAAAMLRLQQAAAAPQPAAPTVRRVKKRVVANRSSANKQRQTAAADRNPPRPATYFPWFPFFTRPY